MRQPDLNTSLLLSLIKEKQAEIIKNAPCTGICTSTYAQLEKERLKLERSLVKTNEHS